MMSDILANRAAVYMDQGRLEEAQTALTEAIGYDAKTQDPRTLSSNLNMLGQIYVATADYKTARIYLTRAKDIATEAGLAKETADAIGNLAIVSNAKDLLMRKPAFWNRWMPPSKPAVFPRSRAARAGRVSSLINKVIFKKAVNCFRRCTVFIPILAWWSSRLSTLFILLRYHV